MIQTQLESIVRRHHQNASRGIIDDYINAYTQRPVYFSHGRVARQFIADNQREYRSKYPRVAETVEGAINVRDLDGGKLEVSYDLKSELEDAEGEQKTIRSRVTLRFVRGPGGTPLIDSQTSKPLKN